MGREARVARTQQGLQAGLLAQSFGSCVPSLHRMGYMENCCLYQISFCQWVADENMYTIVMYDRDWQNQALDGMDRGHHPIPLEKTNLVGGSARHLV